MVVETRQVLDPDGSLVGDAPGLADDDLVRIMEAMLTVRTLDERMMALQRQGRIGFYGEARGQEAATIASAYALEDRDWVFPGLREGGVALLRGMSIESYVHHLFGTAKAVEKGRSMPCHYSDRAVNQVAWSSCIGNQMPQAVGAAYAARRMGDGAVVMAYHGDGATSEPDFHYALNFGALWRAPVVFFCQNNHWAISVPWSRQSATATVAEKGVAYAVPGVRVDGNDVLAVYAATRDAVERARSGDGPTLVEAVTYRMGGHSSSDDPTRYRDADEVEAWRKRDPIERFRTYLVQRGHWDEPAEAAHVEEVNAEVDAAVRAAEDAPAPDLETLFSDVYAEMPPLLQVQHDALREEVRRAEEGALPATGGAPGGHG